MWSSWRRCGAWCARSTLCVVVAAPWLVGCDVFDSGLLARDDAGRIGQPDAGMVGAPDRQLDAGVDATLPMNDASTGGGPVRPPDIFVNRDAAAAGERDGATEPDGGPDMDAAGAVDTGAPQDAAEPDAVVDAGCGARVGSDYCETIPTLPAAPVIDGVLDCGPALLPLAQSSWNGTAPLPAGHHTEVAVGRRDDGLYVYVEVSGKPPVPHPSSWAIYCGDAIEIYVDGDGTIDTAGAYDMPGTVQIIVAAPASTTAPNPQAERYVSGSSQGAWTSSTWQVVWKADGYALEAFIVAGDLDLATWTPSGTLGLDIAIDVAGEPDDPDLGCGLRLGQYFMRLGASAGSSCGGEPWCDTRAFCTPTLP